SRGDLDRGADVDTLLSLLLMILPHLALAPYVRGMDPVLGLDELSSEQPTLVVRRYVAVLSAAFAPRTLTTTTRKGEQSHA
ncbi:TetR family transcriptional regulator, partial [Mycobacterium sp. ITM-2017-0098]